MAQTHATFAMQKYVCLYAIRTVAFFLTECDLDKVQITLPNNDYNHFLSPDSRTR